MNQRMSRIADMRGTRVALIEPDRIILDHGGWKTSTTKAVINAALWGAGGKYTVYQEHYQWKIDQFTNPDNGNWDRIPAGDFHRYVELVR